MTRLWPVPPPSRNGHSQLGNGMADLLQGHELGVAWGNRRDQGSRRCWVIGGIGEDLQPPHGKELTRQRSELSAPEQGTRVVHHPREETMTKDNTRSKSTGAVTGGSDKDRSATDRRASGHVAHRPVSRKSEAIIREISVRRRTAMKVLANR